MKSGSACRGDSVMHKLEVATPAVVQTALRHEGEHSPQSRFVHRLHCLILVGKGSSCYEVAETFGDDPRSVERWVHDFQQYGIDGLREKAHPGRHAALGEVQMRGLALALANSPRELGYAASAWNHKLLRAEILRRFDVTLSARHCQRMFTSLCQAHPPESD
ncbi:MAG: helix-turn-helix domain-containing protein [Burkholderiaceae bacterium]